MSLRFSGRTGRRVRVALTLIALLAAALAALASSPLALPAILLAVAALLWERAALAADLRALAATVAAVSDADAQRLHDEAKLEVAEGAWGELCHALNRLSQQRRAELRLRHLLPALPPAGAARLAELRPPPEGLPCQVAVLALAPPAGPGDPVAALRDAAYVALHQAQLHDALLARWGEGIVLIFGALGPAGGGGPSALRAAHEAARAIAAAWRDAAPAQRPHLSLAGGRAHLVVLPGLGLTVVGPPVEQAAALQALAPGAPLVCNEDAYLGLRRLGLIPPLEAANAGRPAARLPAADGRPAAFALTL